MCWLKNENSFCDEKDTTRVEERMCREERKRMEENACKNERCKKDNTTLGKNRRAWSMLAIDNIQMGSARAYYEVLVKGSSLLLRGISGTTEKRFLFAISRLAHVVGACWDSSWRRHGG
jgi:hypothetical protein